jgi:hypothetical protein
LRRHPPFRFQLPGRDPPTVAKGQTFFACHHTGPIPSEDVHHPYSCLCFSRRMFAASCSLREAQRPSSNFPAKHLPGVSTTDVFLPSFAPGNARLPFGGGLHCTLREEGRQMVEPFPSFPGLCGCSCQRLGPWNVSTQRRCHSGISSGFQTSLKLRSWLPFKGSRCNVRFFPKESPFVLKLKAL